MDKDSKQVTEEAWLICPHLREVRRFLKNKDKFFKYIFVDIGIVVGVHDDKSPLMKIRKEIKSEGLAKSTNN